MNSSDFGGEGPQVPEVLKPLVAQYEKYTRMYQHQIDRTAPHTINRWVATAGLNALFLLRVVMAEGWYIVCYAHAIYLLNLLLAFLQPKFDPSLEQDLAATNIEEGGDELPTTNENVRDDGKDDEFRPLSATKSTVISLVCSFFIAFDIPVYWPILVMYFFALFAITMRRQIRHMIKYKYIPFDFVRKEKYGSRR